LRAWPLKLCGTDGGVNGLVEQFSRFGAARLAAMLAVTLALVGFFGFVMLRMSQPAMSVLFSDLSSQDVNAILKDLDTRGIKYELRSDGQTVLVAKADVPRLRLDLAGKGIPSGGGVGYEIFDKGDAFSSTSFVQNINHLRALEGELSRTIRSISRVQAARVHLVIPEKRLFERDREAPRASIALKLAGELDPAQVRAVRHLVASAVDGLKPERVSIVDERGRLLADGAQNEQGLVGLGLDERQIAIEKRIKTQVEDIVASIVGHGRARVQVSALLDSNRIESRSETFDPESKVIRSSQNRTESATTNEAQNGAVTVGNELPGAQQNPANPAQRDSSAKNEEVVNYEISRTTRTEVLEGGRVKKLSVAVLVDGTYSRPQGGQAGEVGYQPRSQEELERITQLVRTAVGFDQARGDKVEVVNLRFADAPAPVEELNEQTLMQQLMSFTREDMVRLAEMAVISLLTLIVLMVVVRPLLKQVLASDRTVRPIPSFMRNGVAVIQDEGTGDPASPRVIAASGEPPTVEVEAPSERMLAIAQIKGQLKAQSVEKIGAMVTQNPADSVAVLRGWIHEKAPA
jgi:flagellar M-ring protein FliF